MTAKSYPYLAPIKSIKKKSVLIQQRIDLLFCWGFFDGGRANIKIGIGPNSSEKFIGHG